MKRILESLIDKKIFNELPDDKPLPLMPQLNQKNLLLHRGVFSHDMSEYYYTVSGTDFAKFDVKCLKLKGGSLDNSQDAFFNSEYSEHGMSFSPDGKTLFFSSTRPVESAGVRDTWHLWKAERMDDSWSTPEFIDILNLRDKLVSHPSVTDDGTLYFHVSNLDYSEMDIYFSKFENGSYMDAEKVDIPGADICKCTPYISPDGKDLFYAVIGNQLELYVCHKNDDCTWSEPERLSDEINCNGQGNPVLSPDGRFLLYAREVSGVSWGVYWVGSGIRPEDFSL